MDKVLFLVVLLSAMTAWSSEKHGAPLEVVNARMDAYNKHDLQVFIDTYSEDIQVYDYPNIPIGKKGKEHIKNIFEPMFKEGSIQVKIHHQIVQGKYVVNDETVSYSGKETKYVSIYEVENGVIKSVRFIRE